MPSHLTAIILDSEGGGNSYTPPDVSIHSITVESGFAGSLTIGAPDDTDLPQIGGVDDWDNWD